MHTAHPGAALPPDGWLSMPGRVAATRPQREQAPPGLTQAQMLIARRMSEETLNGHIYGLLRVLQDQCRGHALPPLRGTHFRAARRVDGGYRTAIQGDKGCTDWLFAGAGGVLWVECKDAYRKLEPEQVEWRTVLLPTGGYRLWRPVHWLAGEVETELRAVAGLPRVRLR